MSYVHKIFAVLFLLATVVGVAYAAHAAHASVPKHHFINPHPHVVHLNGHSTSDIISFFRNSGNASSTPSDTLAAPQAPGHTNALRRQSLVQSQPQIQSQVQTQSAKTSSWGAQFLLNRQKNKTIKNH